MQLSSEFTGELYCVPEHDLVAGMPNTIRLVYTAGKYGIDDGGNIKFVRQGVTDWEPIQIVDAKASGYTSVSTTGEAAVAIMPGTEGIRPFENAILVKVSDGCLTQGDKIEVVMGDTRHGSVGIMTQTAAEKRHRILAVIDPFGGNRYEEVHPVCELEIKNGTCADFNMILPSTIAVNEEFLMKIRVIDAYGNRCENFSGTIVLEELKDFCCDSLHIELTPDDKGAKQVVCRVTKDGTYRLKAAMPYYELSHISNVCKTVSFGEEKLYWGDMHGQNDLASGLGTMEESLDFAKEIGALDFTGWQGNDFEISDENWQHVSEQIKKYNKEGEFITFLGYEWSGNTSAGGDHNIYFKTDDQSIHRSSQWLYRTKDKQLGYGRSDDGSDCYPISQLWERFEGRDDVMAIPHIGGRHANLDYYNPDRISLIEIHSHHGIFEWFLKEAVSRNLKVGFIASSDDHTSRLGLSYPVGTSSTDFGATFDVKSGLTAVYAKELTRESLWTAFKKRRCYAATSSRIILDFKINGYPMGSEIHLCDIPSVEVRVSGNAPIDHIELYRGLDLIYRYYHFQVSDHQTKKRVKVVWSGVRTKFRKKSVKWNGQLFVNNGRIAGAENYSIDRDFEGIQNYSNQILSFKSKTSGDEDGIIVDVLPEPDKECSIYFASQQKNICIRLDELTQEPMVFEAGDVDCKVEFSLEGEPQRCENFDLYDCDFTYKDEDASQGFWQYYVKVFQKDGNRAWSSPIFVHYDK